MLYEGDKSVNVAARPPEGDPSLPLQDSARKRQSQQQINAVGVVAVTTCKAGIYDIPT